MMLMTRTHGRTYRVGLLLALWALACAPAPAQEPAQTGARGVRMVPPTGEGRSLLAALARPVRARRGRGDGVHRYLVGNDQRSLEDGGPRAPGTRHLLSGVTGSS